MVSNRDKWIRIFDIPETNKHKHGFTIYKVISMLYPESCPDSVTKITVWKRFNDFKKLHREIKTLHRKLNLKIKVPRLPSSSLFKRFDEETIKNRKESVLCFLEYVGSQSPLFMSTEFMKFFETSHTPADHLNSNISLIRADLNLPEEEYFTNFNSDEEHSISDTDSVTTLSSISPSIQNLELSADPQTLTKLKKLNSNASIASQTSKNSDSASISTTTDSLLLIDGQIYPTPPQTPSSSISGDYVQYIIDASLHVNIAIELENNKKYEEAFVAYKTAIDILLKYGKEDSNYQRKQLVRYKTDKYLVRAERIYNMYLAEEVKSLQQLENVPEQIQAKIPLYDLYKYKVIKIINNGMLVLHSDSQQLFYVKVISKTMKFLNDHLILPENVPYMIKLYNHFNCENALFLILEYCSGMVLSEYLKRQINNIEVFHKKDDEILKQMQELSDNESENSFSDLINEYTNAKKLNSSSQKLPPKDKKSVENELSDSSEFEKVDKDYFLPDHKKPIVNIMDELINDDGLTDDLLLKSQQLLTSVDVALTGFTEAKKKLQESETDGMDIDTASSSQKILNDIKSKANVEDVDSNFVVPEKKTAKLAAQLVLALEKLHTLGITCRDLQMKNLLVDDAGDLKLTYMCNVNELCDLFTGKLNINLAPEVYSYHEVTDAADWWNFGAILYELLVGMPLCDVHPNGLTSYTHIKIPKYVSAEGRSLLRQLLTYEPKERLGSGVNGIDYLKSHPFFSSVSWELLMTKYKA